MANAESSDFFSITLMIQVKSGRTLRCGLTGKRPGPLRVHLEGLGCTIENASNNKFVRYYSKNEGPVLCVELSNSSALSPENGDKLLTLEDHLRDLLDCVKQIREIFELKKPRSWSGHSLGATVLLHAATRNKLPRNSHIELISPYSRCLSYYLMDQKTRKVFDFLRSFQDRAMLRKVFSHLAYKLLSLRPDPQLHHVLKNPLHMQASLELILPLLGVDLSAQISQRMKKYRFHLVTAEADDIIPPIVHLHIYEKVISTGAEIRMTVFENYGHFLPYEISPEEIESLFQHKDEPQKNIHSKYVKVLTHNSDTERLEKLKIKLKEKSDKHLQKRFFILLNTQNYIRQLRSYLWNSKNS